MLERRKRYRPPPSLTVGLAGEMRLDESPPVPLDEPSAELIGESLRSYQSQVARLNYYALDMLVLWFPLKELMRKPSKPTEDDPVKLKRVALYLISAPRMVVEFP